MSVDATDKKKEESSGKTPYPFLSHSQIDRYLRCPWQYKLHYIEGLRLKIPQASLVFGNIIHDSLAFFFIRKEDPVKSFVDGWKTLKDVNLQYSKKESWEKLMASGKGLLGKFLKEEVPRIGRVEAAEKRFELNITSLALPFIGIIDLIGEVDGKRTVADFKTSGSAYDDHEAALSDQLTAYHLAQPDAEQIAYWVLVKTVEPKIEWYPATRIEEDLTEYIAKAGYVAREISSGHFYKRKGKHCGWCDFLAVCLRDEKRVEQTLTKIR